MSTSVPFRFFTGGGAGSGGDRGRAVVDFFVVEALPPGLDHGPNWDTFTLANNLVIDPTPTELMVYCQGLKEPAANVVLDQAQGPTIVNVVWTRQPVGGELVEIIYRTEDE